MLLDLLSLSTICRFITASLPALWIASSPLSEMATTTFSATAKPAISNTDKSTSTSALELARQLTPPNVTATTSGDVEGLEFWQAHDALLKEAWKEWHTSAKAELSELSQELLIPTALRAAIHHQWEVPTIHGERFLLQDHLEPILDNQVYRIPQFLTEEGIRRIRHHLTEIKHSSKIPTRRPNAMNRHGIVIDEETEGGVFYPELAEFRTWLVDVYLRPLGRALFPDSIGWGDDSCAYAFTIHYEADNCSINSPKDQQLNEHSDASVVTLNVNLNLPEDDDDNAYEGSSIYFVNDDPINDDNKTYVDFAPGMAVIHKGLHRHAALPITKGQRHNLVVWLFGDHGYVRIAPYPPHEQLTVQQRWTKP